MKKVILIIAFVLFLILGGGYIALQSMAEDPEDIIVKEVNVSNVSDGTYIGEYVTTMVSAEVKVNVADGEITNIKVIEHDCGTGYDAEVIIDDVVDAQSLQVDAISGATLSSKVILKAVEDALLDGK